LVAILDFIFNNLRENNEKNINIEHFNMLNGNAIPIKKLNH